MIFKRGFPVDSVVNNLLAKQKMQVQSLDQEDALEKEMATHPNILAWEIPWTQEPSEPLVRGAWCATVHGVAKSWT